MFKAIAGGLCAWELAALATGRIPTLTKICAKHKILGPVLVGALTIHLYRQGDKRQCLPKKI